ncbi:hypothetical protein ASG30_01385 [Ramlibacter sp. Leaf400]|nr:hypothetical protein ASG30_01385 [Ramlibacter sp. Leaf400]
MAPLALACGMAATQAQTIYRCGDSYGSQPCAGGKSIAADPSGPSTDESRQATAAAQRDAKLADGLEKERLKQEARPAQIYVPLPSAQEKPEPHKWPEKAGTRKLDVFTATGPGTAPPKKDKGAKKEGKASGAKAPSTHASKDARTAPAGRLAKSADR